MIIRRILSRIGRSMEGATEERQSSKAKLDTLPSHPHILVVCHGNICRSPAGETFLKRKLFSHQIDISSAGLSHHEKLSPPSDFIREASAFGLDLSNHRSRSVTSLLVEWADLILVMDRSNRDLLFDFGPSGLKKTVMFGVWDPSGPLEIPDPFGKKSTVMRNVLERLSRASEALAKDLMERKKQASSKEI